MVKKIEKPKTTEVLPPETMTPFQVMERADEDLILAELQGAALEVFVYSFEDKNKRIVTGLSLPGVRETVRVMNARGAARIKISDRPPQISESDTHYEVLVYAIDEQNGGGSWGIKRQAKRFPGGMINEFALEQALSKSQRNALRALIPETWVNVMIQDFLRSGKGRKLEEEKKPEVKKAEAKKPEAALDPIDEQLGKAIHQLADMLNVDYLELLWRTTEKVYGVKEYSKLTTPMKENLLKNVTETIAEMTKKTKAKEEIGHIQEKLKGSDEK
jgi:hypothetical protein